MSGPQQVLWKYPLELTGQPQRIAVTVGGRLAHVAWFQGKPTLWYLVEPATAHTDRWFQIAATGQQMPPYNQALYHGTLIQDDTLVWHIFELLTDGSQPVQP